MQIEPITRGGVPIALVTGKEKVLTDSSSALELLMAARYEAGADRIAIDKHCIAEEFFILSTGLAGEVLQKFINYQMKAAIFGDYSRYTSKPLRDFIGEANRGKDFFFVATQEEALQRLSSCAGGGAAMSGAGNR